MKRAEAWRWGSLWARREGNDRLKAMLSDWPVERPRNWVALVNKAMTEKEAEGIQICALNDFWKRVRSSGASIEAVATDMSPAYIEAVLTHLPNATLIFDRFHVIKLSNHKLSDLRRALYHQLADTKQKKVLKGVRWLLLKRPQDPDPTRNEPQRLQEALRRTSRWPSPTT